MKFVLLIAVFCVVPCAFQDVWDDYDTWYDEFNSLEDGALAVDLDQPKDDQVNEQEPVENDDNKEFHAADYGSDDNYRDYEIEDNRDEVKNKLEKEQEPSQEQDIEQSDDNLKSAVRDFDAFQQIINDDKFNEDVIDKILAIDEKSQMDLDVLLPEELPESDNENLDSGNVALDKEVAPEIAVEQNRDSDENDDKDVQIDIEDIRDETQQLLEKLGSIFDEDAGNDAKDISPEADAQSNMQDIVDETRQILEDINDNFDEDKDTKEKEQNANLPEADIEDDMKHIMDETQQILEKTNYEFNDNKDAKDEQQVAEVEADIKDIIDETRQILEETNNEFDENKNKEVDKENIEEAVDEPGEDEPVLKTDEIPNDEDTVDKVYEDLNEDLDKLFETWKKLSIENNDKGDDNSENADNDIVEENADDDFNRDYANIGDDAKEKIDFDYEGEARILAARNDYYESIADKDLSDLFKDFENDEDGDEKYVSTELERKFNDSAPTSYGNDAIAVESSENNDQDAENKGWVPYEEENKDDTNKSSSEKLADEVKSNDVTDPVFSNTPIKDVDELTSSELEELSQQFVMLHDAEIKMASDDTPIHITLTADEPVVITSPNYPNAYPTDQTVVDWILEGFGTGIEVNITDLAINSAQGHFLMLKPGQSDALGDSGLVFAYRINSDRRYRFRDVNQMFVRFNPLGGMSFSRGFQLSARMIEPPAGESDEEIPEPEFLIPEPQHTATLLLAGVNSTGFLELRDEFQRLLADMATMYINANNIEPGLNSTNAVTQITRSYVCNFNWPGFDSCVQVTFGVPLVYEDEDAPSRLTEQELMEMWDTYSSRDPFAARLSRMGISDYMVPREAKILTMWVLIGVGVVIAAAMLAFALWRYSCIENYTRMQEFSDTDSIHDKKKGLDMYPTPHQTLPPLYAENDYKWADTFDDATRVDMGGFTNNTFTRDEISSESEDDVIVSRDRNSFKPRDFNVV